MCKIKLFGFLLFATVSSIAYAQKTKTLKVDIKPYTQNCMEQPNQQCLQVKFSKNDSWQELPNSIQGFTYEKGNNYTLRVIQTTDATNNTVSYKLKKVISKKAVVVQNYDNKKLVLSKINQQDVSFGGAYVTIDPLTQTIFGNGACNRFNVSYTVNKKGVISTTSGMGTLMACEESKMKLETEFLAALQNQKFKVAENGNDIVFTNQVNNNTITFTIPTEESIWSYIDGKDWKLIQLDNVGQDYGNASIRFDVANKRVSGNTGCNRFFGGYTTNGDQITFSGVGSTRMMCDESAMKIESKFEAYLNSPNLKFDVADQTLNIYKDNKLVMMFAK